jgi:predicted ABC-type ATPase
MAAARPRVLMIAGPNGAGKTTFARAFLPNEGQCKRFINADLIAAGLSPFEPERVAVQAARLMLDEIARAVADGESFALETTLSGLGYLRQIRAWRAAGYRVSLYFLSLPSPELAIARVKLRVQQGGHNIPEPVIRRRFEAGLHNLTQHYRFAVDGWVLYDTGEFEPILLDSGAANSTAISPAIDIDTSLRVLHRAAAQARLKTIAQKHRHPID